MFFKKLIDILFGILKFFFWKFNFKYLNEYEIITCITEKSFGHRITTLDYIARLYKNNKIFIFFIINEEINRYHLDLYNNYINYKIIKINGSNNQILGFKKIFNFYLKKKFRVSFLDEPTILYKILKEKNYLYSIYDNDQKKKVNNNTFFSHKILLENEFFNIQLKLKNEKIFRQKIIEISNIKNPKIFSYIFRRESDPRKNIHDNIRDAGPIKNYFESMNYLLDQTDESIILIDDKLLPELKNKRIINIRNFEKKLYQLGNIFMLKNSVFCVMQHCGPLHLANIFKTPLIISDFLPLWQGSCGNNDLFIPKNFYDKKNKSIISLKEILINYQDIFYGDYIKYKNIEIQFSNKEEITMATKELYNKILLKKFNLNNDLILKQKNYLKIIPKDSIHFLRKNMVSENLLKKYF